MNSIEAMSRLAVGQTDSNKLFKVNLLFVMCVKRFAIIITYAATNRGWRAPYLECILVIF